MNLLIAVAVGIVAGTHTATWGMYKDAPYEGFTWPKYFRSTILSGLLAPLVQAWAGLDLTRASGLVLLFGMTYTAERGVLEFYKTFIREEDQSKYFIPMQFHVMGRVVKSRAVRWSVGAGFIAVVLAVAWALSALQQSGLPKLTAVLLVGGIGGWISAFGGAWKDAPVEGFEWLKFFRSPLLALGYALFLSRFTDDYLHIALGALGYTVASIETYKTFFFPSKPRGKFAGKPIRHPHMLVLRQRFVPVYVAIWAAILATGTAAVLDGRPAARTADAPAGRTL